MVVFSVAAPSPLMASSQRSALAQRRSGAVAGPRVGPVLPQRAVVSRTRGQGRRGAVRCAASSKKSVNAADVVAPKVEPNPAAQQVLADQLPALEAERQEVLRRLQAIEMACTEAKRAKRELSGRGKLKNYGYLKESAGTYWDLKETGVPSNFYKIARENFIREADSMVQWLFPQLNWKGGNKDPLDDPAVDPKIAENRRKLRDGLYLTNDAIWARERARPEVYSPWFVKGPYLILCVGLDLVFDQKKPIERFWFLETVARTPYFSYNVMLYIYEVLGWWRRSSELRRVHFAEEWNEYHHLLIMESLGGDQSWWVRFLGLHSAIVYFGALLVLWLISPGVAYNFSELIEAHAVDTYQQFHDENEEVLKSLPPPDIALEYYEGSEMMMFDEFQTSREARTRRPEIKNLYDVFRNIAEDEGEHVKTMGTCQDQDNMLKSPNKVAAGTAFLAASAALNGWVATRGGLVELAEGTDIAELVDLEALISVVTAVLDIL